MNLCSDDHEEICWEGRICPMCELKKEIEKHEETIATLKAELKASEQ
jgi:hypothetical protein